MLTSYIGNWDDVSAGREQALAQIGRNADVIFQNADAAGLGVFQAARETKKALVIGSNSDQNTVAPEITIASVVIDLPHAFLTVAREVKSRHVQAASHSARHRERRRHARDQSASSAHVSRRRRCMPSIRFAPTLLPALRSARGEGAVAMQSPPRVALDDIARHLDAVLRTSEVPDYSGAMNGVQVEHDGPVTRCAVAVDASLHTIDAAIASRANLLVVHHGLFWAGAQPLRGRVFQRLQRLVAHDVAVYASHLPLDLHPTLGNNAILARTLELDTEWRVRALSIRCHWTDGRR